MIHASLFSGIGGPEVAAVMLGWSNAFHCEINAFGRSILDYYFPESESYEDITKTDFTKWRGRIDVLTAGFPCQPFSVAGQRRGADDDRYLWPEVVRVIREVRPTWFVGENVAGILTMVQPGDEVEVGSLSSLFGESDRTRTLLGQEYVVETVCRDLEQEGYSVQPFVIPACAVGAPHRRDRVFFVAHRTDTGIEEMQCCGKDRVLSSRDVTHTDDERLQRFSVSKWDDAEEWENEKRCSKQYPCNNRETFSTRGWDNFPTQSPVCRRNDGLPFDVDDLTLSYTRWRQESIKAYGNAIVPQVMYEIFKAIEEI